jgi:hypothetical protein
MTEQEEIQIAVNKIIELFYEMFLKDLKSGNINKLSIKSYGKILKKKGALINNDNPTLFNYGK